MKQSAYGLHLMLDAYDAPAERLSNMGLLYRTLCELPGLIGMRRVSLPQILEVTEPDIAGLSGFVFIMESHISVHTYSERGFLTADVYSCKQFDHSAALKYLEEAFQFRSSDVSVKKRGRRLFKSRRGG